MDQFHQVYLRLISFVMLLAITCAAGKADCLTDALSYDSIRPLSVCMDTEKGGFCGLCLMEREGNLIKGSLFNEFGISAFNFEYDIDKGKMKLYDVIAFLNRWYIKKIIKGDLEYLLSNILFGKKSKSKNRELEITYDDKVVLRNLKYNIAYSFSNISTYETIE